MSREEQIDLELKRLVRSAVVMGASTKVTDAIYYLVQERAALLRRKR